MSGVPLAALIEKPAHLTYLTTRESLSAGFESSA